MERRMRTVAVGLILGALCTAAHADIGSLDEFLRNCEAATHVTVPLRGDGQLEVTTPNGTTRTTVVVIARPPNDLYIELRKPGFKALLLSKGQAYRVTAGAPKAEAFAADAPLGTSDFSREDLQPFQLSRYKGWRISDESADEVTVMLFPVTSPYSLEVITFDRGKLVPLKTLYYRETLNNLVKMRRDSNFVSLGGRWLPATIAMETFALHTRSTLTVQWTQSVDVPAALFDPLRLPGVSAATSPAATTPGSK
jgi:hypothetical protein